MKKNAAIYFEDTYVDTSRAKLLSLGGSIQNSETYQALRYGSSEGYGFTQVNRAGAVAVSILSMIVLFGAAFIA
ncbi:hypothetical protein AALA21_04320 [Eggerthellaceae bacterium 3-80]|nr:hypothetical protein D7W09_02955 [bacterium D16-34]